MVKKSLIVLHELYLGKILLHEDLFRPLELPKGVEDRLWKYFQELKFVF